DNFFVQAEDGIRYRNVTGVQTCALPICIREITAEMMAAKIGLSLEKVTDLFCGETSYQTPKVDTRAAIFKDNKILLVHESDGTRSEERRVGKECRQQRAPTERHWRADRR